MYIYMDIVKGNTTMAKSAHSVPFSSCVSLGVLDNKILQTLVTWWLLLLAFGVSNTICSASGEYENVRFCCHSTEQKHEKSLDRSVSRGGGGDCGGGMAWGWRGEVYKLVII